MTKSLIERLNVLVGKRPDEIVVALNQIGWSPCSQIEASTYDRWLSSGEDLVIGRPDGQRWYINGTDFHACSWSHGQFTNLTTHWVIPARYYVQGEHPDVATAAAADRERNRRT